MCLLFRPSGIGHFEYNMLLQEPPPVWLSPLWKRRGERQSSINGEQSCCNRNKTVLNPHRRCLASSVWRGDILPLAHFQPTACNNRVDALNIPLLKKQINNVFFQSSSNGSRFLCNFADRMKNFIYFIYDYSNRHQLSHTIFVLCVLIL